MGPGKTSKQFDVPLIAERQPREFYGLRLDPGDLKEADELSIDIPKLFRQALRQAIARVKRKGGKNGFQATSKK